ncbi:MAG: PHB depolymerase family esterase [Planctomycetota bacterium]
MATLDSIRVEPDSPPKAAVIWMHGLGDSGHGFSEYVSYFKLPPELGVRWIFPHAPERPITLNGGMVMRGWYDLQELARIREEDDAGIRESESLIRELIEEARADGIPSNKIVLAGFSQGGAIAFKTVLRYPERLGAIIALSTYLPLGSTVEAERSEANQSTPILQVHGTHDPVLHISLGTTSRDHLTSLGYSVDWHEYPMDHSLCMEEIEVVAKTLKSVLS